jgi:diguanylate cyclase
MKKWVEKLIEQFDFDWSSEEGGAAPGGFSEERATLLFIIDTYNKHLLELEGHPVRKVRETLDEFAKELIDPKGQPLEKVLFRFRQYFSAYRIDECAYMQKTFEDFRTIIWDFVDQLSEDVGQEQKEDFEIRQSLDELKEAVESNSIETLKNQSRKFIDCYVEKQFKKDKRRTTRIKSIKKNLNVVKKQLTEANDAMRVDHLTQALNRKSFDEYCVQHHKLHQVSGQPLSLLLVDIDHFKRINDTYGHPVGDFILKELVGTLKKMFTREADLLCRIGGEEFAIILPDYQAEHAVTKAEEILSRIRGEVFVHNEAQIRFTVSIGLAQLHPSEPVEAWVKRADEALYYSKNHGRNRLTVAAQPLIQAA